MAIIPQDLLAILRCPLQPSTTRLVLEDDQLRCERCSLKFPIKDGFPILVVEEAQLPEGCEAISDLPCQKPTNIPVSGFQSRDREGAGPAQAAP